jgi:hypothetical protein
LRKAVNRNFIISQKSPQKKDNINENRLNSQPSIEEDQDSNILDI